MHRLRSIGFSKDIFGPIYTPNTLNLSFGMLNRMCLYRIRIVDKYWCVCEYGISFADWNRFYELNSAHLDLKWLFL